MKNGINRAFMAKKKLFTILAAIICCTTVLNNNVYADSSVNDATPSGTTLLIVRSREAVPSTGLIGGLVGALVGAPTQEIPKYTLFIDIDNVYSGFLLNLMYFDITLPAGTHSIQFYTNQTNKLSSMITQQSIDLAGKDTVIMEYSDEAKKVYFHKSLKDFRRYKGIALNKWLNRWNICKLGHYNLQNGVIYNNGVPFVREQNYAQTQTQQPPIVNTISMNTSASPVENVQPQKVSDVDRDIPNVANSATKTFAIIFANEEYKRVAGVPFAKQDGQSFRNYCHQTLGLPDRNIHLVENATLNDIRAELGWLSKVCEAYNGEASIIFYYAGHGIPDEASKTAYLLPTDGYGTDVQSGYKLDDLYANLGSMYAKQITVFMDACFSGSKREEGMLASARGVAIKAKTGMPQGNMVVFSAAQGDETAYPNNDEGHGMFTYYLLKKLQETEGDVTLKDLGDYITTNVRQQSIVLNSKSQTPCVTPASAVADSWQSWKLK